MSSSDSAESAGHSSQHDTNEPSPETVFVGNINWKATEDDLHACLSTFGEIAEVKIIRDFESDKSKGYGFVTFKDLSAAEKVKEQQYITLMGKKMNVGEAYRGGTKGSIRTPRQRQQQQQQRARTSSFGPHSYHPQQSYPPPYGAYGPQFYYPYAHVQQPPHSYYPMGHPFTYMPPEHPSYPFAYTSPDSQYTWIASYPPHVIIPDSEEQTSARIEEQKEEPREHTTSPSASSSSSSSENQNGTTEHEEQQQQQQQ